MQEEMNIQKGFSEVYEVLVVIDPNIIKVRADLLRTRSGVRLRHQRSLSGVKLRVRVRGWGSQSGVGVRR